MGSRRDLEVLQQETHLAPPDPGKDLARLFGWMKKLGLIRNLNECKRKWKQLGHDPDGLEDIVKSMGKDRIRKGKTKDGEWAYMIVDRAWADDRACFHQVEQKHHGQKDHPNKAIREYLIKK